MIATLNPNAPAVVYAVDPGVDYYAVASFLDGLLIAVNTRQVAEEWSAYYLPSQSLLVIEEPQIIERAKGTRQGAARKRDVANLLISTGRVIEKYASRGVRVETRTPAQWKGQLPKKIDHERTREALTPDELRIIDSVRTKEERGHLLDAVGIGLVYLWRRR
jgi:hypothetical protein